MKNSERHGFMPKQTRLAEVTQRYMSAVRKWRPEAQSVRMISPQVLVDSGAEAMYAHNFDVFLDSYDEVVVMANPLKTRMVSDRRWLARTGGRGP